MNKLKLPVIESFLNKIEKEKILGIENILFVCVQHLLDTTVDLFQALIELGVKPENIFVTGKHYSSCDVVIAELKSLGIYVHKLTPLATLGEYEKIFNENLIGFLNEVRKRTTNNKYKGMMVLDDGGRCLRIVMQEEFNEVPIVGIEQTRAGLYNSDVFYSKLAYIDVASCAAKKFLEPTIIVEELLEGVFEKSLRMESDIVYGVVGLGVIGRELVKKLQNMGFSKIIVQDKNPDCFNKSNLNQIEHVKQVGELISKADYIFGCTGRDIVKGLDFKEIITKDKTFISCSSEDIEFLSMLKLAGKITGNKKVDPLQDVIFKINGNVVVKIISGGFPVNFNRIKELSSSNNIQLTRGLLLAALLQANLLFDELHNYPFEANKIMLSPLLQKIIVNIWQEHVERNSFSEELLKFHDTGWIKESSAGIDYGESALFLQDM